MSRETKKKERKSPLALRKKKGKPCFFCEFKIDILDYKDISLLGRFQSPRGKILPRRQSFCCAKHQRKVSEAIKRARIMALLPFVADQ